MFVITVYGFFEKMWWNRGIAIKMSKLVCSENVYFIHFPFLFLKNNSKMFLVYNYFNFSCKSVIL